MTSAAIPQASDSPIISDKSSDNASQLMFMVIDKGSITQTQAISASAVAKQPHGKKTAGAQNLPTGQDDSFGSSQGYHEVLEDLLCRVDRQNLSASKDEIVLTTPFEWWHIPKFKG